MHEILSQLEAQLGESKPAKGGQEQRFNCPFCEKRGKPPDSKFHMYVNLNDGVCHCFRCEYANGLDAFLSDIGISADGYVSTPKSKPKSKPIPKLRLPSNFQTILPVDSTFDKMFYKYLQSRNVPDDRIQKHQMGYVTSGDWVWRAIIPFYNYGELEYYVGRGIRDTQYPKYMNPTHPRSQVVFNLESAETVSSFIAICEGVFSALAWGDHGLGLLSKKATAQQVSRIVEIVNRRKLDVLISLDGDAKPEAYALAKLLQSYDIPNVLIAIFPEDGDPASSYPLRFVSYCGEGATMSAKVQGILGGQPNAMQQ